MAFRLVERGWRSSASTPAPRAAARQPAPVPASGSPAARFSFRDLPLLAPGEHESASARAALVKDAAGRGLATPAGPLPMLDRMRAAFVPHDVDTIRAHVGGDAEAAARQMGAQAYATTGHVVLPANPSAGLVAHEVAHVLQQRAGALPSHGVGRAGDVHERQADAAASAVVRGASAARALGPLPTGAGPSTGVVQLREAPDAEAPAARPPVDWTGMDDVVPGSSVQQRRALLGGVDAEEVLARDVALQAWLEQVPDGDRERLRAGFLAWAQSVIFREGPGAIALVRLMREEAALVTAQTKARATLPSIQAEVAHVRARHASDFAVTLAALKERFLDDANEPRPHQESIDRDVADVVVPNDARQQTMAVVGATTAAEVFDLDPQLVTRVRSIAEAHAVIEGEKATSAAAADASKRLRDERGEVLATTETLELEDMAAEAAIEHVFETTVDQRFAEMRGKFLKWGGRVLFQRSTGRVALNRLAADEKALVKRAKGSATLRHDIVALRRRHAEAFRPKLAEIKERFVQGAAERLLFWHEKQAGVKQNETMRRLPDTVEGATAIKDLAGLIKAEQPELVVAESVVAFARILTASSTVPVEISTYPSHSWGRYSLDLFPQIARDPARGLYDVEAMVTLFLTIDRAARATGVKWRALYNDFEVAKRVNAHFRLHKIGFQWEHGPAPYVLHVHLDLTPRALDVGPAMPP